MTTRNKTDRLPLRRLVALWFVVAGVAVAADGLLAATDAKAFLPGGWAAEEALQFDPFSLITSGVGPAVAPPSSSAKSGGGASKAGSGGSGEPEVGGAVRVPYRVPARTPFRPPL